MLTFLSIQFPCQFSVSCSRDLVRSRADKTFQSQAPENVKNVGADRLRLDEERLQLENWKLITQVWCLSYIQHTTKQNKSWKTSDFMNIFVEAEGKLLSIFINPADTETINLSVQRESICNLQLFRMDITWLLL